MAGGGDWRGQINRLAWRPHVHGCTLPGSLLPSWLTHCRSLERQFTTGWWAGRPDQSRPLALSLLSPLPQVFGPLIIQRFHALFFTLRRSHLHHWFYWFVTHQRRRKRSKRGLRHCFIVVLSCTSSFQLLRPKVCYVNLKEEVHTGRWAQLDVTLHPW